MNEQIEKIYGEACILYGNLSEREFCEKFAQMLIKKCAGIADTHDCNLSLNGDSIRMHFGVEE
jgi:hypothetical protein